MRSIMNIFNLTNYRDSDYDWETYREKSLLIGHSIWRVIIIQAIYLTFVLCLGPLYMRNRKPFGLRWTMRAYNLLNLLFNLYNVKLQCDLTSNLKTYFTCESLEPLKSKYENFQGELLFYSRVIDLLDTVFFVLRKKDRQINFLHVYHHTIVPLTIWIGAYMSMRPYSSVVLHMNSTIHVIMYSYYFLASFPSLTPYLWWKKYITRIQIAQFIILFVYLIISCPLMTRYCDQEFPYGPYYVNVITSLKFFALFVCYYRSTYKRSRVVNKKEQNEKLCIGEDQTKSKQN